MLTDAPQVSGATTFTKLEPGICWRIAPDPRRTPQSIQRAVASESTTAPCGAAGGKDEEMGQWLKD